MQSSVMYEEDLEELEAPYCEEHIRPSLSDNETYFYHNTPRTRYTPKAAISLQPKVQRSKVQQIDDVMVLPLRPSLSDNETYFYHNTPRTSYTPKAAISFLPKVQRSEVQQIDDVMALCSKILKNSQIKAAVDNSYKGATAAGGGAFLGGLLGGPPGIFIGGAVGSAVGWWMTRGKFRPLYQIITEMTPKEKKKLYSEVMAVLDNLAWDNLRELIVEVMGNSTLEKKILDILISFAIKQLRAKVKY